MAIKQQLSAVGLYLAIVLLLYGQKEIFSKETYEANKAILEADKRDDKENLKIDDFEFVAAKKKGK